MRMHGNLINRILEDNKTQPVAGMGCTLLYWSDRRPDKVAKIISPKRIVLESGHICTKRQNGAWRLVGETMRGGIGIRFGVAEEYTDPHF